MGDRRSRRLRNWRLRTKLAAVLVVPLLVIGANSIAIYVMSWTIEHFISSALIRHFGTAPFLILGPAFEPVLRGIGVLIVFWLILYWMYRRKIFLRI